MMPQNILAIAHHLWQSTAFAGVVTLLALVLRRNSARMRFQLWLAASIKFLIPFSLLVSLGQHWEAPQARAAGSLVPVAVEQFGQAFMMTPQVFAASVQPSSNLPLTTTVLLAAWACGFCVIVCRWALGWVRIHRAVLSAASLPMDLPIPVRSSAHLMEPGVFGIFRPVLLLPQGITDRLNSAQFGAVVAHELCHVKRHDNLWAALHMAVESLFWFHPLVWWIGARLVQEREHACDEEVLRLGNPPEVYAQGILNVCRFCLESPLPCVAGVTGSNLKNRIETIIGEQRSNKLDSTRKLLLAAAGLIAITGPVTLGVLHSSPGQAQTLAHTSASLAKPLEFEVATIKPASPESRGMMIRIQPGGGLTVKNSTMTDLIAMCYDLRHFQISGGPAWMGTDHFDVEAKTDAITMAPDMESLTMEQRDVVRNQFKERLRRLLAERFHFSAHTETREMPIYALVQAKGGSKLQTANQSGGARESMQMQRGILTGTSIPIEILTNHLGNMLGRPVMDKTGLVGRFDWKLEWTPETAAVLPGSPANTPAGANPPEVSGPSLFSALQEQLGLKLESQKGPAPVLIVDHVQKPSAN